MTLFELFKYSLETTHTRIPTNSLRHEARKVKHTYTHTPSHTQMQTSRLIMRIRKEMRCCFRMREQTQLANTQSAKWARRIWGEWGALSDEYMFWKRGEVWISNKIQIPTVVRLTPVRHRGTQHLYIMYGLIFAPDFGPISYACACVCTTPKTCVFIHRTEYQ